MKFKIQKSKIKILILLLMFLTFVLVGAKSADAQRTRTRTATPPRTTGNQIRACTPAQNNTALARIKSACSNRDDPAACVAKAQTQCLRLACTPCTGSNQSASTCVTLCIDEAVNSFIPKNLSSDECQRRDDLIETCPTNQTGTKTCHGKLQGTSCVADSSSCIGECKTAPRGSASPQTNTGQNSRTTPTPTPVGTVTPAGASVAQLTLVYTCGPSDRPSTMTKPVTVHITGPHDLDVTQNTVSGSRVSYNILRLQNETRTITVTADPGDAALGVKTQSFIDNPSQLNENKTFNWSTCPNVTAEGGFTAASTDNSGSGTTQAPANQNPATTTEAPSQPSQGTQTAACQANTSYTSCFKQGNCNKAEADKICQDPTNYGPGSECIQSIQPNLANQFADGCKGGTPPSNNQSCTVEGGFDTALDCKTDSSLDKVDGKLYCRLGARNSSGQCIKDPGISNTVAGCECRKQDAQATPPITTTKKVVDVSVSGSGVTQEGNDLYSAKPGDVITITVFYDEGLPDSLALTIAPKVSQGEPQVCDPTVATDFPQIAGPCACENGKAYANFTCNKGSIIDTQYLEDRLNICPSDTCPPSQPQTCLDKGSTYCADKKGNQYYACQPGNPTADAEGCYHEACTFDDYTILKQCTGCRKGIWACNKDQNITQTFENEEECNVPQFCNSTVPVPPPPTPQNCSGCLGGYSNCSQACEATFSDATSGYCAFSTSTDPGRCCGCTRAPLQPPQPPADNGSAGDSGDSGAEE